MPAYNTNQGSYLQNTIQSLQTQLNALSQQQQYVIVDQLLRLRVQLGLLGNGDYGILLQDSLGNQQELLPAIGEFDFGGVTTNSTTPVTLTGFNVNFETGHSGDFTISTCSVH